MSKCSSPWCSVSFFLILFLSVGFGQEKNGEFKHELPDGVELVDPKSLGLTDADLSKFLGNVKVLGGGQIGDTKTQILTVGFEGDENINFNEFDIPGLTDGNSSALPQKDKEIADMAFQKFKEFFADPNKAKEFEKGRNNNINLGFGSNPKQEQNKHQLQIQHQKAPPPQNHHHQQQHHPHQFHIPMIQKPYTTPRTPPIQFTTNHPSRYVQPPPPPPLPQQRPVSHLPPVHNGPPPPQHVFNSQIKTHTPPLEFGARIPVSPNPQMRFPPTQQTSPHPQNFQNPGQQFHHQQQHRLAPPQHNPQQNQHPQQQQRPFQQQIQQHMQPPPPQHQQTFNQQPQIQFIQHPIPQPQQSNHNQQSVHQTFPPPRQQQPQTPPPSPRVPVQSFSRPQQQQQHQQQQHPPQAAPAPPPSQQPQPEQGRVVRNQLLQVDQNNNRFQQNSFNDHLQLRPPPPPSQSVHHSASNQIPIQTQPKFHAQFPSASSPAMSHVYIQRGSKKSASFQHTNFHPQFQPPTRFSKDFTPSNVQLTTTGKPTSFQVTPSMKLIPLSTNENAITDPTRMLQLRMYQRQQQQQKAQASNTQASVVPQQATTPAPTTTPTTTPISITTSYPEYDNNQQFAPSPDYQQLDHNQIGSQTSNNDNDIFNKLNSFSLQTQPQQHQLHILQQPSSTQQSQSQNSHANLHHHPPQQQFQQHHPTVFYTQEHRRPPRQGHQNHHHPGFQFHVSHELGQGPRVHMQPDPKSILNTIRRKRGYRRLSNLFNRMFRWDRN